ncbi:hypothetical protein [Devosia limi]|uniref:Uncharacterized protein n=1 Tax=Devosia limi DSM 17137 TaxID=1121477 RepID=A0A1M5C2A3_9HYPH|nr:hypothetical protein SAMN02745223_02762 [Devosia limi DSM 17137]
MKAALIEPFAIACMMDVYFRTIEGQEPNAEWDAKLSGMSKQFAKIKDKAAGWQQTAPPRTGGSTMQGGATT